MELEFQQIDRRYEGLRKRDPRRERQLLASLGERGQTCPVVVLRASADRLGAGPSMPGGPYVLLDGYKRLRALTRLRRDTVQATLWELDEAEALVLERLMHTSGPESPLEQGWLLCELRERFGMSLEELGRRFDRTPSWVSRRLALVRDLPGAVQEQVRRGRIAAHTAMRVLLPLARANGRTCLQFLEVLLAAELSTREAVVLQAGWLRGDGQVRERILANPRLFLRVRGTDLSALEGDLRELSAVARRALSRTVTEDARSADARPAEAVRSLPPRVLHQARWDCTVLFTRLGELPGERPAMACGAPGGPHAITGEGAHACSART